MSQRRVSFNLGDESSRWKLVMGIVYACICVCDFILFPVLWSLAQFFSGAGHISTEWQPLTLQGAGIFHMAMGAILGVSAWREAHFVSTHEEPEKHEKSE